MITDNYVVWRKDGPVGDRLPAEADAEPGAVPRCDRAKNDPPDFAAAIFAARPVAKPASAWSAETIEDGDEATLRLRLPPGSWRLSLAYDATRPVSVRAAPVGAGPANGSAILSELPGNLDYRGPSPYWPAGEIEIVAGDGRVSDVELTATVEAPPLVGRALGATAVAHLGAVAATRALEDADGPFPGGSERIVEGAAVCGAYVDWIEPARR